MLSERHGTFFIYEISASFSSVSKCLFRRCHLLSEIVSVDREVVFIYHCVVLNECDYLLKTKTQAREAFWLTLTLYFMSFTVLVCISGALDDACRRYFHFTFGPCFTYCLVFF